MRKFIDGYKIPLLLGLCLVFAILRLPSLIEPYWYADEGIYQVIGKALLDGRMLYREIWDNKPPFLYIIYAFSNSNLFIVKLLSLISGLASVIALFLLTGKLFKRTSTRAISTSVYAILFALPLLEGNIANAENFMLFPVILSAYFLLSYIKIKKVIYLLGAGILLSFALATKIVAAFDFIAFITFLLITNGIEKNKIGAKKYFYFFVSFISLLVACATYFVFYGAFGDFFGAVFLQNLSYVGEENRFIFPMGMLVLKTIILLTVVLVIILYKKKFSVPSTFIYLWIIFGIYSALFSDRPYTHYLLLVLPAFSLLTGHLIENKRNRLTGVVLIIIVMLLSYLHFKIYTKTVNYYINFISFMTNSKSIVKYQTFFDKYTPRDYGIASFISLNVKKNEVVFLWSDSPQIYALSEKLPIGKYIVAYHIKFYKNADIITKEQLEKAQPKYIIQTVEGLVVNDLISTYKLRYIVEGARVYEKEI